MSFIPQSKSNESTYMQWYIIHTICYVSPIEVTSEEDASSIYTPFHIVSFLNPTLIIFLNNNMTCHLIINHTILMGTLIMLGLLQMLHNLDNKSNFNPPSINHPKYSALWTTTTTCLSNFSGSITDVWASTMTPPFVFPSISYHALLSAHNAFNWGLIFHLTTTKKKAMTMIAHLRIDVYRDNEEDLM